jgi:outer membrane cobalamin receptor
MRVPTAVTAIALATLVACGGTQQAAMESGEAPSPEKQDNFITQAEIEQAHASSVYDAITKLRGNFLSNRGKTTILGTASSMPVVYLDAVQYGTVDALKSMSTTNVATIRLYRAWEAAKFGPDKTGGVIEITSRKQ